MGVNPARAAARAPLDKADLIPDADAVWRDRLGDMVWRPGDPPPVGDDQLISVDYGDGAIERTSWGRANWLRVVRWRFGWAPR